MDNAFSLINPAASDACRAEMRFFRSIAGKRLLSGYHLNFHTGSREEMEAFVRDGSGAYPAIVSLDLIGETATAQRVKDQNWQLAPNFGSVRTAIEWARRGALIAYCWHWLAPVGDPVGAAFYQQNTSMNLKEVMEKKGSDFDMLVADMDTIAAQLRILRDENIPVLWRPLHEAHGNWFWWGMHGRPDFIPAYQELYRFMYHRFTDTHGLNNLIWVWEGHQPALYVGDNYCDINAIDSYDCRGTSGDMASFYREINAITDGHKPVALSEIGALPDPAVLQESRIPWLWFVLWNNYYKKEEYNSAENVHRVFHHPYVITLDELNRLYPADSRK